MKLLEDLECEDFELSIVFCNDKEIAVLNKQYRNKAKATDVLSFSLRENSKDSMISYILGDIVISVDSAKRQAREKKLSAKEELLRLLIHGFLHLLGYDHENVSIKKARAMQKKEDELLNSLGLWITN
ncbi:MAG: rRNA maturation RNase YbeY [Deltaproteobacteria bacterium]|nr:rRNA maturation RNase YbeY [Deltaproteobacteria bacterium]